MGAKLKIAFLVVLAGVLFSPPDMTYALPACKNTCACDPKIVDPVFVAILLCTISLFVLGAFVYLLSKIIFQYMEHKGKRELNAKIFEKMNSDSMNNITLTA